MKLCDKVPFWWYDMCSMIDFSDEVLQIVCFCFCQSQGLFDVVYPGEIIFLG